eukprot:scaffold409928_cov48-Attheya_sp.AAC.2
MKARIGTSLMNLSTSRVIRELLLQKHRKAKQARETWGRSRSSKPISATAYTIKEPTVHRVGSEQC